MISATFVASLLAGTALASPAYLFDKRAMRPYTADMPIHESCNATEREALTQALADVKTLAQWGKDYVVTNGAQDPLYLKWFGQGDYSSVVGVLDSLMSANKINMTLRCDNIDGNCGQEGWAGHWRGSNATSETVICPLSYEIREPLTEMCRNGHTIANASASYFFGTDLIHRMYHLPGISDSEVSHYADSYNDCLELAQTNSSWAPFNTHTIQYFVAEAYANEIAAPGQGCTGEAPEDEDHDGHSHSTPTATTSAAQSCHTHSDGEVHCV